ncbi:iron-containing alcohol dehydrogenase [Marinomonas transparens]|uniref:Iron-containing alcohol dehydrogenase n=1 Tax=Marinomonas transparens TaxID=2795388 RepID=A0A934JTM1_9GAMM|nr:iron-containing alcohol dehydrogenase [Marinomonas transparens]MBJ7536832.1 iron-containing alcohol dehydrogenase [Marinomonas transparens]
MNTFHFNTAKSIHFGVGALSTIGQLVQQEIGTRVMLVTDSGMMSTGIVDQALTHLSKAGIDVVLFQDVIADPTESVILSAVGQAKTAKVEGIIGLGGGSSLDVAKLIALLCAGESTLASAYGVGNASTVRLPLLLVPTTAGTGSEVTPIAIVTTGSSQKMGVVSPTLLPDIALLDPLLTLGLPPHITAATGIDAMVHAIESYASTNPNNNPISRFCAEKALQLISTSLLTAVRIGTNLQARSDMLLGSMLAGQAFANSPVAAVHALAYPLGGYFHIPHGLSNALVLPHVLRFNLETSPQAYCELATLIFPELNSIDEQKRGSALCDKLVELSNLCGLPQSLREMKIPEEILPVLAKDAMKQTRLLANNPRSINESEALSIYQAAY